LWSTRQLYFAAKRELTYERFSRQPNVETVFACEVIFGIPARELFAGVYQKVEETIKQRAQVLAGKLNAAKPDRFTRRKLENLRPYLPRTLSPTNHGLYLT
jgi:hypothetical protein